MHRVYSCPSCRRTYWGRPGPVRLLETEVHAVRPLFCAFRLLIDPICLLRAVSAAPPWLGWLWGSMGPLRMGLCVLSWSQKLTRAIASLFVEMTDCDQAPPMSTVNWRVLSKRDTPLTARPTPARYPRVLLRLLLLFTKFASCLISCYAVTCLIPMCLFSAPLSRCVGGCQGCSLCVVSLGNCLVGCHVGDLLLWR